MKHFFYFFTIFAILWEISVIFNPARASDFLDRLKKIKDKKYSGTQTAFTFLMLFYTIWTFAGLFTSQWVVFAALLILSFIPKKFVALRFIDSVISLALLVFIILNAYHLHIDLLPVVLSWFA